MPLSSFAPLYGILQGAQDVQNLQNQQQLNQLRQFALQQAQQQQQVGPAAWNAIMGGAGGLPQQGGGLPMPGGGVPQQPLLQPSPQQPQAPAPVGGGGPLPGFQLPQLPSLGPFGPPGGGGPSTLPGFDGTTYGVGGGLGSAFSQLIPGSERPASPSDLAALGFGPPGSAQNPFLQAPQQPTDTYAPDPLTGQIVPQPPITTGYSQQQPQPQAPAAVGDPGTPPQQGLPQQTGADPAGLFASTILPIESGGRMDPAMTGAEGEIGPAQIKPATFQQYAQSGESIYNLQDNIRVGQRIADDLWQKSGGDPAAVLVGYNAGEGAMRTFQRAGDDPRSVRLAPQYQEAVARQQGRQTYAELNGHINAVTSPQEKALGAMGTRNTLGAMPNPLAFAGRIDAPQLAHVIEATNPGVSANVKMAVFEKLYPMLSKVGQEQFQQAWEQHKEAVREREHGEAGEEKKREFEIRQQELQQQRQFNQDLAKGKFAQGTGWQILPQPDGSFVRANPNTGEVAPINLQPGTTRMPAAAAGAKPQMFTDPSNNQQYTMVPGRPETAKDIHGNPYSPQGAARIASGSTTAKWGDDAIEAMVDQGLAGDPNLLSKLPRSGPARQQYEEALAKKLHEFPGGIAGGTASMMMNQLRMAEAKTAAQAAGRVTMNTQLYSAEAEGAAKLVVDASRNVPRTSLVPVNQLLLAAETQTGDPNVVKLGVAINSLLNAYGKMSNPTGTGIHDADKARLAATLDRSLSQGQIEGGVEQIILEGRNLATAAQQAQIETLRQLTPRPPGAPEPQAPPLHLPGAGGGAGDQLPDAAKAQLHEGTETTFGNGQKWTLENGQPKRLR
jgi:hypothetical protein